MSATGRGAIRAEHDYYRTPPDVVAAILPHLPELPREGASILDPAAGRGEILSSLSFLGGNRAKRYGIELDPVRARKVASTFDGCDCGDFLELYARHIGRHDLVVMNPPYSLALRFVVAAIEVVRPRGGAVFALLRLGFLASAKRRDWWQANPADVYVLSRRPSFTGDGRSDSADYAWFSWRTGATSGKVVVL